MFDFKPYFLTVDFRDDLVEALSLLEERLSKKLVEGPEANRTTTLAGRLQQVQMLIKLFRVEEHER